MYLNFVLKNLKNNIRDYVVYFFTIAVSISLFYAFGVLDKSHEFIKTMGIYAGYEVSQINFGYNASAIIVGIVLAIVIIYSNTFFIKRRRREVGVCLSLGMSKRKIAMVMFLEAIFIGIIALVVGIILGIVFSQLLALASLNLIGVTTAKYKFIFSSESLIRTFIYFIIIFIIVGIYNMSDVAVNNLKKLMSSDKQITRTKAKGKPKFIRDIVILIIGLGILITGYFMMYNFIISIAGLPLVVLGIIIFIIGVLLLISDCMSSSKRFYYSGINIFSVSEIKCGMSRSIVVSIIAAILLTVAMLTFMGAGATHIQNKSARNDGIPVGATISDGSQNGLGLEISENMSKIKNLSTMKNYNYSYFTMLKMNAADATLSNANNKNITNPTGVLRIISLSEFNSFQRLLNKKPLTLNNDEAYVVSNIKSTIDKVNEASTTLDMKGPDNNSKNVSLKVKGSIFTSIRNGQGLYDTSVILPDSIANKYINAEKHYETIQIAETKKLNKEYSEGKITLNQLLSGTNYNNEFYGFNEVLNLNPKTKVYGARESYSKVANQIQTVLPKVKGGDGRMYPSNIVVSTKYSVDGTLNSQMISIVYSCVYVGLVFVIIAGAIIGLSELISFTDEKEKYRTIRKLGASEGMIKKSIITQLLVRFIVPFIFAIVNGVMIIKALATGVKVGVSFGMLSLYSTLFVGVIYLIYIFLAYIWIKKVIE